MVFAMVLLSESTRYIPISAFVMLLYAMVFWMLLVRFMALNRMYFGLLVTLL